MWQRSGRSRKLRKLRGPTDQGKLCVYVVSSYQLRRLLAAQHGLGELTSNRLLEVLRQDGLTTADASEVDARRDGDLLLQSELTDIRERVGR